eukprot:3620998-Pyramimonas_sp.AAC.1
MTRVRDQDMEGGRNHRGSCPPSYLIFPLALLVHPGSFDASERLRSVFSVPFFQQPDCNEDEDMIGMRARR